MLLQKVINSAVVAALVGFCMYRREEAAAGENGA
jgi:hypothetical protein